MRKMMHRLSIAGFENKTPFSAQEVLADSIISLDEMNRRLVAMIRVGMHQFKRVIVHLNEVQKCSVKKVYGAIHSDDLSGGKLEHHLKKIVLQLEYANKEQVEIPLYTPKYNSVYRVPEIEQKARKWEARLSRLLKAPKTRNRQATALATDKA